jgi:hypothetical protein
MNNLTLKALNTLIATEPKVEDAFYAVTLYDASITMQGRLNEEALTIAKKLGIKVNQHEEKPWFEGTIFINGVAIHFTLTL